MLRFLLFRGVSIVVLILGNGFFVAAELALVSVRRTRVEQMIAQRRPGARLVLHLQEHLDDFLPAVQLGVTLCSLALGWIGEPVVADVFEVWLGNLPHSHIYAHLVAVPVAFAFITYLQVLLGELVPKALALRKSEQVAVAVAGPMDVFIRLTRPAIHVMNRSAQAVLRLFRAPLAHESSVHSPEELKLMATAARRTGMLPEYQEALIHRAVEINQIPTREIMTPRQRIFSLPFDMLVEEASARIIDELHSRVPVYDPARGPEFVVGVVYSKDISRLMHFRASVRTRFSATPLVELRLRQVMREVLVVPETKPVLDLLHEFQARRRHLAIVVDEFGTTVGLVTVEDAIEQLIGEVEDEFDVAAKKVLTTATGGLVLDGSVNLRDLETQMRWSLSREGGVETLAGFLLARLGHIPTGGETIEYEGRRFTVLEMSGNRISRVRIETTPKAPRADHPLLESAARISDMPHLETAPDESARVTPGSGPPPGNGAEHPFMRLPRAVRALLFRLVYTIPVVWLVVSIVFILIHLVPGDPVEQMLGEGARPADIVALRHAYGLDLPLGTQYLHYWMGVLHGNLGNSLRLNDSITHLVLTRYPYTVELTVAALIIAVLLSIPAGIESALRRNRWQDRTLSFVSLLGLSFPAFALGPILILLVSIKLGWLPVSGAGGITHLILPAITMGSALAAILTRMVRTAMLEELGQDYIRTARAKGLPESIVIFRHALRNALIPVITLIGLQFGALLAGAIVTETIFSWPGIGRLTVSAINNRDYPLLQGCILAIGLTYVLVNLATDITYVVINPRIRD